MANTDQQKLAVLAAMSALVSAIGDKGIPSGELYAIVMGKISLDGYTSIISSLKTMGYVTESAHYLKATDKGMEFARRVG